MLTPWIRLFQKEKFFLLLTFLATCGVTAFLTLGNYIPLYKSEAKLYIRNISRDFFVTPYGGGSTVHSESGYSNPLFNYIEILQSEKLAEVVFPVLKQEYGQDLANFEASTPQAWLTKYPSLVSVKIIPSTDVLEVTFNWSNPDTASQVFYKILDAYRRSNLAILKSVETSQREYLDQQLKKITEELATIRLALRTYRQQNHSIDLEGESAELTKARVMLQKELEEITGQMMFARTKTIQLTQQLGLKNPSDALKATGVGEDPYLVKLNQDLADAQQRYAKLTAKFTDSYPDVIQVKFEMGALQYNIQKRKQEILGNASLTRGIYDGPSGTVATDLARAQADFFSLHAQRQALMNGIQNMLKLEGKIPGKQMGLQELLKQESALMTAYNSIRQKQIEASLKENESVDNIILLSPPTPGALNLKDIGMKLAAILVFGVVFSLALTWVKEGFTDRWSDTDELEDLTQVPTLAVLPWVRDIKANGKRGDVSNLLSPVAPELHAPLQHVVAELDHWSRKSSKPVVMFYALNRNEQQPIPTLVPAIAKGLAMLQKRVLWIDLDPKSAHKTVEWLDSFDVSQEATEDLNWLVLALHKLKLQNIHQVDDSIFLKALRRIPTQVPNFLPVGYMPLLHGDPFDVIGAQSFQRVLSEALKRFDVVLLDHPALPPEAPEIQTLARLSEKVVIIPGRKARRRTIESLVALFQNLSSPLGLIVRK